MKWVLQDANVTTAIAGMKTLEHVKQMFPVMGMKMTSADARIVERYAAAIDTVLLQALREMRAHVSERGKDQRGEPRPHVCPGLWRICAREGNLSRGGSARRPLLRLRGMRCPVRQRPGYCREDAPGREVSSHDARYVPSRGLKDEARNDLGRSIE